MADNGPRGIDKDFVSDLKNGRLSDIFSYVNSDPDLSLEIRSAYISIYYKGGSLLKIEKRGDSYAFRFDTKYCSDEEIKNRIRGWKTAEDFTDENLSLLKGEIDGWMAKDTAERKFQHEVLLNCKAIADIEYQIPGRGGFRLDMILANKGHLVLVENKCGSRAISSRSTKPDTIKPGIRKHYRDFVDLVTTPEKRKRLIDSVNNIYQNKYELGIVTEALHFDDDVQIDFLFVLFDYNHNSRTFQNEIDDIKEKFGERIDLYDTRVLFIEQDDDIVIDFDKAQSIYDYKYGGNRS